MVGGPWWPHLLGLSLVVVAPELQSPSLPVLSVLVLWPPGSSYKAGGSTDIIGLCSICVESLYFIKYTDASHFPRGEWFFSHLPPASHRILQLKEMVNCFIIGEICVLLGDVRPGGHGRRKRSSSLPSRNWWRSGFSSISRKVKKHRAKFDSLAETTRLWTVDYSFLNLLMEAE